GSHCWAGRARAAIAGCDQPGLLVACHSSSGSSRVATLAGRGRPRHRAPPPAWCSRCSLAPSGGELWTVASAPGEDGKVCQTVVVRPAQTGATIGRGETEPSSRPTCAAPPGPRTDPVEGLQYRELPAASLVTGLVPADV